MVKKRKVRKNYILSEYDVLLTPFWIIDVCEPLYVACFNPHLVIAFEQVAFLICERTHLLTYNVLI